jgi:hypothetical protein
MIRPAIALLAALAAAAASGARTEPVETGVSWLNLPLSTPKAEPVAPWLTKEPKIPESVNQWNCRRESMRSPQYRNVLPPAAFDKSYKGKLTVVRVNTEKEVSAVCAATWLPYKLGCATHSGPQTKDGAWAACRVIIAADDIIREAGYTPEIVLRHELGHCNGWPGDHKGARFAG